MHVEIEQDPADDKTIPRAERVRLKGRGGRNLRAGNGERSVLVDVHGKFVGLSLGRDWAHEHRDEPEGITESLGVAEDATTIRAATMTRHVGQRNMRFVDGRGHGDKYATTLIVNNRQAEDIRFKKYWLAKKDFVSQRDNTGMWRAISGLEPTGIVTGWSYDGFGLAGWDEEARERIEAVHEAYLQGSLAVALHYSLGPILILAGHFDPRFPVESLVADIARKRHDVRGPGSALYPAVLTVATRDSEIALARTPEKPETHRFEMPDGTILDVPRDIDALQGWTGEFHLPGVAEAVISVYDKDGSCRAPFLAGTALPPDAFGLGRAWDLVRTGVGNDADGLRKALLEGKPMVCGDTLTFPCGEPVWWLGVTPKGLLCKLTLSGIPESDAELPVLLPVRDVAAVREVATELGQASGVDKVKQIGRIDYVNPFSGGGNFETLNLESLARHAGAAFDGWADAGLARKAMEAAGNALAEQAIMPNAQGDELPESASAFLHACAEIYEDAVEREPDRIAVAVLGVILQRLGKIDREDKPGQTPPGT